MRWVDVDELQRCLQMKKRMRTHSSSWWNISPSPVLFNVVQAGRHAGRQQQVVGTLPTWVHWVEFNGSKLWSMCSCGKGAKWERRKRETADVINIDRHKSKWSTYFTWCCKILLKFWSLEFSLQCLASIHYSNVWSLSDGLLDYWSNRKSLLEEILWT